MANPRSVSTSVSFNGKNVTGSLAGYIKAMEYNDVASNSSDSIKITLHNIDMAWLNKFYPQKGDKISGSLTFNNWTKEGDTKKLSCGSFVLDDVGFSGGPLEATMDGLAIPASDSFKSRERTKTWKNVTIKQIGTEIAGRYGLKLGYDAPSIKIKTLEQSEKTDSAFLYELAKAYGLAMKVFMNKILIYDKGRYEAKKVVATIDRADFVDDAFDFHDSLTGTYTGARISYKGAKDDKEISTFIGLIKEDAKGSRVLKINETADDINDAKYKAAAAVNLSNESATTLSGQIFANPKVVAGTTVNVTGLGKANGKYFVDKVSTRVTDGATEMFVELHKCQKRLTYTPKASSPSSPSKPKKKTYKVGDIVTFKGGKHYVSSYPGAKGYSVKAGKAKITIANGSGKAHPWHLVTQNWSQTHVWGWVDEGSFE